MTTLEPQGEGIPLPTPTPVSQPFWDGCGRGELLFQRCRCCGLPQFSPAPVCRTCGGNELTWAASRGEGVIYSWTVAWRPAHPSFKTPYAVAIVQLDEGYQMLSNIIGCAPEDLCIGMRVSAVFHAVGGGVRLPYFRPRSEGP